MIKNPMIGMNASSDEEDATDRYIVFELFGEDGERTKFVYTDAVGIEQAILMLKSGLLYLNLIDEIGIRAATAKLGLSLANPDDN